MISCKKKRIAIEMRKNRELYQRPRLWNILSSVTQRTKNTESK